MNISTVLFVDDDIVTSLETCTLSKGTRLRCPRGALRLRGFQGHEIQPHHLDALVTDIDLGPGDNGFAVAKCARAMDPNLLVIFISGMGPARLASERVEPSVFIAKPFHPQQIADAHWTTSG